MAPEPTDSIRQRTLAAMERRAAGYEGETRRVLEEKIQRLRGAAGDDATTARVTTPPTARGPLGGLVDSLAAGAGSTAFPELPLLEDFRRLWSRVRAESQLRQSMAPVPEHAGPLNSAALVHRSIALMRELSPGYLQHFLAYVDDLSWLERIAEPASPGPGGAQQPATIGKRTRKKPRK
ncbi:MAG: DUF2894 domain-containing protein [Luteibacter sp.]